MTVWSESSCQSSSKEPGFKHWTREIRGKAILIPKIRIMQIWPINMSKKFSQKPTIEKIKQTKENHTCKLFHHNKMEKNPKISVRKKGIVKLSLYK